MNVTQRKVGKVTIMDLDGPLRRGDAEEEIYRQLRTAMADGATIVALNLAAVPMVDSSGIKAFLRTQKSLEDVGGKLTLFAPTKMVRNTFHMVGLEKLVKVFDDEAGALAN